MRVVVVGAGGHGQVVADVLMTARKHGSDLDPIGYVDDDPALAGKELLGLRVLGDVRSLGRVAHDAVIVAIGDNHRRRSIFSSLEERGERFIVARHPSAIISSDVKIGIGTLICAGVVINPGTTIGSNVILNTGCSIDHHNRVGDHVHVGPGVHTGGDVTMGHESMVGIGAIIMPGRKLGANSIVGAAALVQQDVDDATVVVGVPARPLRKQLLETKNR